MVAGAEDAGTVDPSGTPSGTSAAPSPEGPCGASASRRAIVLAVLVGMTYIYPAYLVGALGVAIRNDIGLDSAALGTTISLFFAVGAVVMSLGGRVADRLGPRRALRLAAGLTGACLIGVALFGGSWAGLLVAMAVGGVGSAVGAPLGALLIVRNVAPARRPLAFGLERSSLPASTLMAGLALPVFATVMHWRLVFLMGTVAVVVLMTLRVPDAAPPPAGGGAVARGRLTPMTPLVLLTVAFFLCSASATALSGFFVDYGVALGLSQSMAGVALAAGSATIIVVRLALGLGRGRRHGRATVAVMMALGAAGFLLLVPGDPAMVLPGMLVACGAGWGWTGVVALVIAETYPAGPGMASGFVQAGGSAGGIVGPLLVGAAAEYSSYSVGWGLAAAFCALASVTVLFARAAWKDGR